MTKPTMRAKKVLVPTSGKTFHPPTPQELRASWDAAQRAGHEDDILDWKVIGPFKSDGDISLSFAPLDEAVLSAGAPDLETKVMVGDNSVGWQEAVASKKGHVSLNRPLGTPANAVAYAYTEVESIHGREAVVKCGSSDGIKVWLNGKVVHENDTRRGYEAGADEFPVFLAEGKNSLLVKVTNHSGSWGFSVAVPKANF